MHPAPESHDPRLWNEDLAPVPQDRRTWTTWNIAALWIGMAVCIPTYTLASGLIGQGMNWSQAVITIFLGNLIVLVPMTLNAHPGTAYGIPFPVLLRASFGTFGSNIPALMRGIVACGWFGIQTWVGGAAIYSTAAVVLGFGFFFVNQAASAFGSAEVIPPWLAAWLPPILTALAAFTLLFYTEDG